MSLTITINTPAPATLTVGVGVPGATGPAGAAGQGVPVGGTAGQFLTKINSTNYNTDWTTLPAYLQLAGGTMNVNAAIEFSDTTSGTVSNASGYGFLVSSASNGNLTSNVLFDRVFSKNATSQTTLKPTGVEFPDLTLQTTAGLSPATAAATYQTLAGMSAYAPLASPVFTGNARAVTATFGDNDTSISTTAFVQAALAGGTAIAKSLEVEVRNQSGASIPAGSIVYISGATGNKPLITLSQANNDANSAQTMGFTKTAIANNAFGFVIVRGEVENLNTSALTEGAQLYLSPTVAGAYTTTKPSAPQHLVYVGIVIRAHPNFGTILVAVQNGYELNELHDVAISAVADNNLLAYESSTTLWKNKSFATLGLLTSADAATTYLPLSGGAMTGNSTITVGTSVTNLNAGYLSAVYSVPGTYDYGIVEPNSLKADHQETGGSGLEQHTTTITGQQTNFAYSGFGAYGARTGASSISYSNLSFSYNLDGITGTGNFSPNGGSGTVVNAIGSVTTTWSLSGSGLAWNNGTVYGEFNSTGVRFPDGTTQSTAAAGGIPDAPSDSQYYARLNASWVNFTPGLSDAPSDSQYYARLNGSWSTFSSGISDAPADSQTYGRNNNAWVVAGGGSPTYYSSVWVYGNWYSANVTTLTDGYGNYYNGLTF
jgi:hypothetical protein